MRLTAPSRGAATATALGFVLLLGAIFFFASAMGMHGQSAMQRTNASSADSASPSGRLIEVDVMSVSLGETTPGTYERILNVKQEVLSKRVEATLVQRVARGLAVVYSSSRAASPSDDAVVSVQEDLKAGTAKLLMTPVHCLRDAGVVSPCPSTDSLDVQLSVKAHGPLTIFPAELDGPGEGRGRLAEAVVCVAGVCDRNGYAALMREQMPSLRAEFGDKPL